MKDKVLIVGTTTATAGIGGVTVHVERLLQWLVKMNKPAVLCDYKRLSYREQLRMIRQYDIIHLHVSHPLLRVFYVTMALLFRKKCILTVHGNLGRFGRLMNKLDALAVRLCSVPILINKHSYDVASRLNKQARYISAFLPPLDDGFIDERIEEQLRQMRRGNEMIFATNASYRKINHNGDEVYGIDFLIEYFSKKPQCRLIVSDSSGEYKAYYERRGIALPNNVFIISSSHSFLKVLRYSDIMIRNTQTDGDSVSIKEALLKGKNVFASDCVNRPVGVYLFKYNDLSSFAHLMGLADSIMRKAPVYAEPNAIYQIIGTYNSLVR